MSVTVYFIVFFQIEPKVQENKETILFSDLVCVYLVLGYLCNIVKILKFLVISS